ncbi:diguanylate cyclase (GGDEF)-like protein/PAS domain S-box-containing protein [Natronospira proteinivora]|uniref:Diguanylate cyclase (GGDEF)-like protein/PAS domain S-box-containing protein n=1 Tax=Natronospira proteinivora TaxID=1807133 RepID=A0ABT1G6A7_9GAMM|nr:EAL domain-containing protein [Natronospira proteinivora]MCP1726836.1 diguanylate cyclase (GGDEF)-like protein/PAS domain S-box-containing protein [Natronospira proteinivora]
MNRLSDFEDGFYRTLIASVPDAVYVHDIDGQILEANQAATRQTGYEQTELCRMTIMDLNPFRRPDDIQEMLSSLSRNCCASQVFRTRHRRADGEAIPVEVHVTPVRQEGHVFFLAVVRDMSDRERLEMDLQDKVEFDQLLLDISSRLVNIDPEDIDQVIHQLLADIGAFFQAGRSYVFTIDHDAKTFSNTHEWSDDGVAPEIDHLQRLPFDAFPWLMKNILNRQVAHAPNILDLPDEVAHEREEYRRQRIRSLIIAPIVRGDMVTGLFGLDTVRDKRYWNEDIRNNLRLLGQLLANAMDAAGLGRQLKHLAYHDSLTQLPNRQLLKDRIEQGISRCQRESLRLAVMLLDLDDFKLVNDTLSHSAGDELLCQVAKRLTEILRDTDTVARLGGDEFVLVTQVRDADEAAELAKRALDNVSRPIRLQGQRIVTHPSIGISLFPDDDHNHDTLMRNADLAMYAAKAAGKNRFAFYDQSMTDHARNMLHLRHELVQGIQEGQLLLHFQPRVDLRSRRVCGMEALVRWQHPERGLLMPGMFLPLAERSDLICLIDHWVLETARKEMLPLAEFMGSIRIAVNLSARDLYDSEHLDHLLSILKQNFSHGGVLLELEITESTLMQDVDAAIAQLHRIKQVIPGVRIAIDDFGSGYSSLNYLRRLPIDILKIDQSFIRDLGGENPSAEAIIRSIIELARNLGMRVVAEGIETESEALLVQGLGCDEAQGYFYSQPVPMDELIGRLDRNLTLSQAI